MVKCLSIRQPYAWAIVNGYKPVENRTWQKAYPKQCLIHAGKAEEWEDVEGVIRQIAHETGKDYDVLMNDYQANKNLGCIVGAVDIVACVTDMDSDWFYGPYGYVMTNARTCPPLAIKGQLGFFDVPAEVLEPLRAKTKVQG